MTYDFRYIIQFHNCTIFGEFEALNEQPRFTYAIAQQRSLILIVQLKSFIECFKQSKLINFEVSQLYARRKQLILQQFKLEKIELKRLKRKNLIIFEDNDISPEFHKRKTNDNHLQTNQIYHYNLLKKIIGQAKLNKQIVYQRFQFYVNRVIDYIRQIDITPPEDWKDLNEYHTITKVIPLKLLQQRNSLFRQQNRQSNFSMLSFNKKLRLSNYILVRQQEINIQRKIILFSKMQRERFKPIKQIFDKYGRAFENPSSETDILNFESSTSSKIALLQSKYCQWFNVKQHEEIKINKNIANSIKKLSQDLSKINDTWLQGSLIKFDLHKYLNQK